MDLAEQRSFDIFNDYENKLSNQNHDLTDQNIENIFNAQRFYMDEIEKIMCREVTLSKKNCYNYFLMDPEKLEALQETSKLSLYSIFILFITF